MAITYEVDPISRIEGHLGVKVTVADTASAVTLATNFNRFTALYDSGWKIWQTPGGGVMNYSTTSADLTVEGAWTVPTSTTPCTFAFTSPVTAFTLGDSPSVIKDGSIFRLYCGGCTIIDGTGTHTNQIGYAQSANGYTWTNAQLALDKSVDPSFMGAKVDTPCVIKDNAGLYRMWFQGTPVANSPQRIIGYATSPLNNGITFSAADSGVPAVPLGEPDSFDAVQTSQPGVDYDGGVFKMYYRAVNASGTEKLAGALSYDGIQWTKTGLVNAAPTTHYNEPIVLKWGGSRYFAFVDANTKVLYSQNCAAGGSITEANAHGNLWRGFENFLIGRRANDAITFTQRICGVCPVPHGTAATFAAESVLGVSSGYATFSQSGADGIPEAALHVRNMVLGAEFLMSHITHFYHLVAQSYVQGPPIPPWTPYFADGQYHALLRSAGKTLPLQNAGDDYHGLSADLWSAVITQYVKALRIRRLCLEAGALFAGRMPMMSNSVAGGTTNTFRDRADFDAKLNAFRALIEEVGTFVVREYIPLALALGALYPDFDNIHNTGVSPATVGKGWGAGLGNFLAWGGFPTAEDGMAIKGGVIVDAAGTPAVTKLLETRGGAVTVPGSLLYAKHEVETKLEEFITCSHYANTHGYEGVESAYPGSVTATEPDRDTAGDKYSWLKAPRWDGYAMEVGPLARMVVNGKYPVDGGSVFTPYGSIYADDSGDLDLAVLDPDLVSGLVSGVDVHVPVAAYIKNLKGGLSTMDRLRARAVESFWMAAFILGVPTKTAGVVSFPAGGGWIGQLKALGGTSVPAFYRDTTPPVGVVSGYGLVEAPRGALGHFITASNGKIKSYQCVVPTTWNGSPKDGTGDPVDPDNNGVGTTHRGAIEQAMIDVVFDATAMSNTRISGVEVLRVAQSFDPCIACAVH